MLKLYFVSIHPKFISSYFDFGVFQSAQQKQLAEVKEVNLRDYALDKHGTVDGPPYGGGDGMIMRPEPLVGALTNIHEPFVVLTSPRGKLWTQDVAISLAKSQKNIVFVCGRFGGVDQRFIDRYVDEEFSIGDVVVSGGELPALMMADSMLRQIPGVLGHQESAVMDSFGEGCDGLLEHDQFTRPADFDGQKVPDVLMSGDHKKIAAWRLSSSLERTKERRPDLLDH